MFSLRVPFSFMLLLIFFFVAEARSSENEQSELSDPRSWVWKSETPLNILFENTTKIEGNRIVAPIDQLKTMIRNIDSFENISGNNSALTNGVLYLGGFKYNFSDVTLVGNFSDELSETQVFSEYFLFMPVVNRTTSNEKLALRIKCTVESISFGCSVSQATGPSFGWAIWLLIILVIVLLLIVVGLSLKQCGFMEKCCYFGASERPEAAARYTVNRY